MGEFILLFYLTRLNTEKKDGRENINLDSRNFLYLENKLL